MPCRSRLEQLSVSNLFLVSCEQCYLFYMPVASRICAKLANGEIQVARDQWPIFLYANYTYDSEDPWNGLLRSGLLVAVSLDNAFISCTD